MLSSSTLEDRQNDLWREEAVEITVSTTKEYASRYGFWWAPFFIAHAVLHSSNDFCISANHFLKRQYVDNFLDMAISRVLHKEQEKFPFWKQRSAKLAFDPATLGCKRLVGILGPQKQICRRDFRPEILDRLSRDVQNRAHGFGHAKNYTSKGHLFNAVTNDGWNQSYYTIPLW